MVYFMHKQSADVVTKSERIMQVGTASESNYMAKLGEGRKRYIPKEDTKDVHTTSSWKELSLEVLGSHPESLGERLFPRLKCVVSARQRKRCLLHIGAKAPEIGTQRMSTQLERSDFGHNVGITACH